MTASADLMEGWKALEAATDEYLEALAYYRGTAAERFANQRIRDMVERTGQGYHFRLAAIPVKVMAKRCRIATVASDSDAVTKLLNQIREANQAQQYERLIIKKTFTYGDAFVLVWPVGQEEADLVQRDGETVDVAAEEELAQAGVEISFQSPLHCRVIYDGEDGRRPRFAIRRWCETSPLGEGQDRWRAEVFYGDRLEAYITRAGAKGNDPADWTEYAEDDQGNEVPADEGVNWPQPYDWAELPIKHVRTDMPYGEPAHAAAYGPQDAITKAITTQVVVDIEAHGWPERYRLLDDQRILEQAQDQVNWGDNTLAPAADATVPTTTARRRGSGMEHTYAGTKAVGEYAQPDPGLLIAPIDQWTRLMSVVTETPLYELDQTAQVSGVAKEKADGPLRAKERDAKIYLEAAFRDIYSLAVRMAGVADPGTISIHWVPPDVTMDAEWWATAQIRRDNGIPARQILEEANYLPEQVSRWLDQQGEEMALLQRIQLLERLGAAVQTLGVGVQLGVLDQPTVDGLVNRIVGEMKAPAGGTGAGS